MRRRSSGTTTGEGPLPARLCAEHRIREDDDRVRGETAVLRGEQITASKSVLIFHQHDPLFSDLPLKLGIYSGVITALFGLIMVIYTVYTWELYGAPNGYATIVV